MVRYRPMVTIRITNRKSQVADRSVPVPVTVSDLESRVARGQNFGPISVMNDFGTETQVGEVFLGAQPSQRAGHQRPSTFLELPYLHPNVLTYRATKYDNTWGSGVPREWGTSVPKIFFSTSYTFAIHTV